MREILFRGKRHDNGEWVYGSLIHIGDFCGIVKPHQDKPRDITQIYPDLYTGRIDAFTTTVKPETVGQYTGLTDKSGEKIFEDDVLSLRTGRNHIVEFADGSFSMTGTAILIKHADKFEIVGNIHDNPKLLGGDNNAE